MSGYKISEAARATGFSESALRFYEREGVVIPERTSTGYRNYNDEHVEALRFVARGKQLGLTLEEIAEILMLFEQDECEPAQTRIQQLIHQRVEQAQEQIARLVGFTAQLQNAAARLGAHTPDGRCDDQCGCRSEPRSGIVSEPSRIPLAGPTADHIACSLDPEHVGARIGDWNRVLDDATGRESITKGVRVRFRSDVDIGALAELAAAEQACCGFFRFNIGFDQEGVTLDVTGPEEAQAVIVSVFGAAGPDNRVKVPHRALSIPK